MKIKTMKIENYRCFQDDIFSMNRYSCFVGPNGSGKSSILNALNVFFREQASTTTDMSKLNEEDYFYKDTSTPIRITITFDDLSETAQTELADYVRQNELVVTVEAVFNPDLGYGQTKYYGQRLGMGEFRPFFDALKAGARAEELTTIFEALRQQYPELQNPRSKDDKAEALRTYESAHPDSCVLIPSEDNFYGINSTGKLANFVQWIFVPAVKDVGEEEQESKNTALGKLIARTVRTRVNFDADLGTLRNETMARYRELLERNQASLTEISQSLQQRLADWAHPDARLGMEWLSDPNKAVVLQQPVAGIKTGEGDFLGSIARMGHGLQRSYLLALLQVLADSDAPNAPTMILGCEEPELYQHPPQARHLAEVLNQLATGNNQIILTTHSPLFVSGDGFENTKLVHRTNANAGAVVRSITFPNLCNRIRQATGEDPRRRIEGMVAKIHQALQPGIAEMFFARIPILVEGLEDVAYITTELHLSERWSEFRRLGCHLIPVNGKDKLIQPLAIAIELNLPVFVIFDADGNVARTDQRIKHERDNRILINLLGMNHAPFPTENIIGHNHAIWHSNLTEVVRNEFGDDYVQITESARQYYAQEGGLEKNGLFIAEWLTIAYNQNLRSTILNTLCENILTFSS